jgi:hypothetical protein
VSQAVPRADGEVEKDEVQSSADPDAPRRSLPKPLVALLAVLLGAAAVGSAIHAVGSDRHHPVAVRPAPVPSRPGGQATTSCGLSVSTAAMTFHRADWPRIDAPSRPARPGLSVLAWSVTPLLRVDLASGEVTRPVLCAGAVDGVYPVTVPWARVMNITQDGHRRVWWVDRSNRLAQLAGDEQTAGGTTADAPAGAYAVPGLDGSLLVVTSTHAGQTLSRYTSLDRSPVVRPLDPRYSLIGEVAQGLVVRSPLGRSPDSTGGELLVVDPRTDRVVRDLGRDADEFPVVRGDRVAWVVNLPCRTGCLLRVADLSSGGQAGTTDVDLPGTGQTDSILKAFAPDGSSIAVSYPRTSSSQGRVGVVSVASAPATTTWIAGIKPGRTGYAVGTSWSEDGRTLVLSTSTRTFGRFATWDVSSHRLTAMPWAVAQDISQDLLSTVGPDLQAWSGP